MASGDDMPKLNLEKEGGSLSSAQRSYMKLVEEQNLLRAKKILLMRRRNTMVGSFLGLTVVAIYAYSIFTVKQERFLDELDE